jgi:aminopeptidase-like protein
VRPEHLEGSLRALRNVIDVLEHDAKYVNREPFGEPQLGKRGLYQAIGGTSHASNRQLTMLWILNQSDGTKSLLDIAERAGVPFADVLDVANVLREHELLAPVTAR